MNVGFHNPWFLILLVLAVLPIFGKHGQPGFHPALSLLPDDPLSRWLDWLLRLLGVIAIAALTGALAGLHQLAQPYQHISRGAEIAIVLDRSRSMDQRLVPRKSNIDWRSSAHEKKGIVAQRVLSEFVDARTEDHFAFVLFSTRPMPVSGFTRKHGVIQAAIAASQTGRGISETELGEALEHALRMFEDRPFIGPRAIMLVSDGGARLDVQTRKRLTRLIGRARVALYWIYLRSFRSPGLLPDVQLTESEIASVPEHFLHQFFKSSGAVYKAYEAESPKAMQAALDDVKKLEDRPIRYQSIEPIKDLDRQLLAVCLGALVILCAVSVWLVRAGRHQLSGVT